MVFSQRWIRLESTSGSVRWYRVRISRMYTAFIKHAAGGVNMAVVELHRCWAVWPLCCVETRVWRWRGHTCAATWGVHGAEAVWRQYCVLCTVYSTVYCVQHCTAGWVTSRHCHGLPGSATLPHQGHRPAASRSGLGCPHSLPSWSLGWNYATIWTKRHKIRITMLTSIIEMQDWFFTPKKAFQLSICFGKIQCSQHWPLFPPWSWLVVCGWRWMAGNRGEGAAHLWDRYTGLLHRKQSN